MPLVPYSNLALRSWFVVSPDLPSIDAHAHIATDVTASQVKRLGGSIIFAVTRSLSESLSVPHGCYPHLVWGLGVHPRDREALESFDAEWFERLLPRFALVGEVGLDRKAARFDLQKEVLSQILERLADEPVMTSLHSSGAIVDVLDALEEHAIRLPILHWFSGTGADVRRAVEMQAWFSVNAAMSADIVASLPSDRVLTETDFPYTRRVGAKRPGDSPVIERQLSDAWQCSIADVRGRLWSNLRTAVAVAENADRLPPQVRAFI